MIVAATCKAELHLSSGSYLTCDRPEVHGGKHRDHRLLRDGENVIEIWWTEDGIHPLEAEG